MSGQLWLQQVCAKFGVKRATPACVYRVRLPFPAMARCGADNGRLPGPAKAINLETYSGLSASALPLANLILEPSINFEHLSQSRVSNPAAYIAMGCHHAVNDTWLEGGAVGDMSVIAGSGGSVNTLAPQLPKSPFKPFSIDGALPEPWSYSHLPCLLYILAHLGEAYV